MIQEDYVTPETAKLLKEKGFKGDCIMNYIDNELMNVYDSDFLSPYELDNYNSEVIDAPTLQMAMKWLREKGIYITIVYGDYPSLNKVFWTPQIDSLGGFNLPDSFYKEYDKYE